MKLLYLFLLTPIALVAQEINQFDAQGERHGPWKKTYPGSDQVKYEGTFEHGKEVGVFKFYCEKCGKQPAVVRTFNTKDNSVLVQYYTGKGQLVSEGKMISKIREGEWITYHKNSQEIMSREHYKSGVLDGLQTTYYPTGKKTEEVNYVNGKKQGLHLYYSPEGVLIKKLKYTDDLLQGPAFYYDSQGNLVVEGFYKDDKKHGLWKYYKNGALELEETYPKPQKRGN